MKIFSIFFCLSLLVNSCSQNRSVPWDGPTLTQPRDHLTIDQLSSDSTYALMDMSFFGKPEWAGEAIHPFSGSVSFNDTETYFP